MLPLLLALSACATSASMDARETADTANDDAAGLAPDLGGRLFLEVDPGDDVVDGVRVLPQRFGPYLEGTGISLTLDPAVRIDGSVVAQRLTPWGIAPLPSNEVPAAASITLEDEVGTRYAISSDADGRWALDLVPGLYTMAVVPQTAELPTTQEALTVLEDVEIDLDLGLGLPLYGRLVDAEGSPIAGAAVYARSAGGIITAETRTDDAGWYQIRVHPGRWTVVTRGPTSGRDPTLLSEQVELSTDGGRLDLAYVEGARAVATLGLQGPEGSAADRVTVRFVALAIDGYPLGRATYEVETTTDSNGNVSVRVPEGVYDVEILPAAGRKLAGLRLDDLDLSGDVDLGRLQLAGVVTTTWSVEDDEGLPLASARVRCTETDGSERVWSDATDIDGRVDLETAATELACLLRPPPARTDLAPLFVRFTADGTSVSRTLGPGVVLDGDVQLATSTGSAPLPFAVVRVFATDGEDLGLTVADEAGRFVVRVPPDLAPNTP